MNCKEKQEGFKNAFEKVREELESEIRIITEKTTQKAKELADSADSDNNLSEGIGIAAGTAIGSYFGGPAGGAVGASVGKEIGKLFEVEIYNREEIIKFDLPEIRLSEQSFKFDLPEITMKENDIFFNSVVIEMVRQKVGETPHQTCSSPTWEKPIPECTITWTPNYIEVPIPKTKEIRISMSLPEVSMRTQEIIVSIPEISMRTQDLILNIPSIKVTSKKDIGEELSEKANELIAESKVLIKGKKEIIRAKIKMDVIPKATEMFNCFKNSIIAKRAIVSSSFDPAIEMLNQSLLNLVAQGVPQTDDDYINLKHQLNSLVTQRGKALESFDAALEKLDLDMKTSLESIINL
jgi:hypothetical protein